MATVWARILSPKLGGVNLHVDSLAPPPLACVVRVLFAATKNQLNVAYGYGVRRDDGAYTCIVQADEIIDCVSWGIPRSQGPEGLIIFYGDHNHSHPAKGWHPPKTTTTWKSMSAEGLH